jgi:hypothetical protein
VRVGFVEYFLDGLSGCVEGDAREVELGCGDGGHGGAVGLVVGGGE